MLHAINILHSIRACVCIVADRFVMRKLVSSAQSAYIPEILCELIAQVNASYIVLVISLINVNCGAKLNSGDSTERAKKPGSFRQLITLQWLIIIIITIIRSFIMHKFAKATIVQSVNSTDKERLQQHPERVM